MSGITTFFIPGVGAPGNPWANAAMMAQQKAQQAQMAAAAQFQAQAQAAAAAQMQAAQMQAVQAAHAQVQSQVQSTPGKLIKQC